MLLDAIVQNWASLPVWRLRIDSYLLPALLRQWQGCDVPSGAAATGTDHYTVYLQLAKGRLRRCAAYPEPPGPPLADGLQYPQRMPRCTIVTSA